MKMVNMDEDLSLDLPGTAPLQVSDLSK